MKRICLAVLLSGLVAPLLMAGCTGPESAVVKAGRDGVLLVGNGAEPQGLDPHLVTGVPEHRILTTLFEGLADVDPATLEPIPAVAESWKVSDDGRVYTFALRDTAKWSNGDPVTAHDFAYAWKRILTPALGCEYAYILHCIVNARAYNEGTLDDFGQVGVRVADDRTLEVTLTNPTPYFLAMQIHNAWFPVHRATIEQHGRMDERGTKWTRPGNFVGNGAFALDEWRPDSVLTVRKNPEYWNVGAVALNAVKFFPIKDLLSEERSFRSGGLHLTENVLTSKIEAYERDHPDEVHIDPYYGAYYYRLNVKRPPFDDVLVRRALAMAIDRETLVARVVKKGREPAGNLTPPGAKYSFAGGIGYNVEEAQRLLAEAGYPGGEGFPKTELLYNTSEDHKLIAEAIQQMWKNNLGIEVGLLNQDWKVYLSSMTRLDYQIARSGWIADFVDPINFLECFTTGNGNNRTGWSSEAYDALIEQAGVTLDPGERLQVLEQAERILVDEVPLIPIYFYTRAYLKSPDVKGLDTNLIGYISFKRLRVEPADNG